MISRLPAVIVSIIIIVVAAFIVLAAGLPANPEASEIVSVAPSIGAIAPPLSGMSLGEQTGQLDFPANQIVILNFWATWCAPCEAEMPELEEFAQLRPDVRLIGINSGEPADVVTDWLQERQITFQTIIDVDGSIYADYRIFGQPTTYIVGADGIITHIFYGSITSSMLFDALESLKET